MAARVNMKLYTLTGSPASLETILNSPPDTFVSSVTLRAGPGNAGTLYWQLVSTEKGGYLEPREAASFDLTNKFVRSSDIYISGTASDTIYITVFS